MNNLHNDRLTEFFREWNDIPAVDFSPRPVLSVPQWRFFAALKKRIGHGYGLFAGASLTAFLDPGVEHGRARDDLIAALGFNEFRRLEDVRFTRSVLFGVTSKPTKGSPILFIVDGFHAGASKDPDKPLERLLTCLDLPFVRWSYGRDPDEYADEIALRIRQQSPVDRSYLRSAVNPVEYQIADVLLRSEKFVGDGDTEEMHDSSLSEDESKFFYPRVLKEVKLTRITPRFMSDPLHLWRRADVAKAARQQTVDILICRIVPSNRVLLGIEIDGSHHLEPAQIKKDEIKNEIFKRIGVPLLRILPADVRRGDLRRLDAEEPENLAYRKMLPYLVQELCYQAQDQLDSFEEETDLSNGYAGARDKVAKSMSGKAYAQLPDSDRELVDDTMLYTESYEEVMDGRAEQAASDYERRSYRNAIEDLDELTRYCPRIDKKEVGDRRTIETIFRHDGVTESVPMPSLYCVADRIKEDALDEILFGALHVFLREWIVSRLKRR